MESYEIEPDLDDTEICDYDNECDQFLTDGEADEDALASAGHGLDESYYGMDSDSGEWTESTIGMVTGKGLQTLSDWFCIIQLLSWLFVYSIGFCQSNLSRFDALSFCHNGCKLV